MSECVRTCVRACVCVRVRVCVCVNPVYVMREHPVSGVSSRPRADSTWRCSVMAEGHALPIERISHAPAQRRWR